MRLLRLVALGSLVVLLVACAGTATTAPGGGASQPTNGASAPASGGGSLPVPAGGGGTDPALAALAQASTAKMCALLTTDEAKAIIGKPIALEPNGMSLVGLGTNCIYETESGMADGTWIKIEIAAVSYTTNGALINLAGSPSSQTTVGGHDATAIEPTTKLNEASLLIRLTDPTKAPSMLIQAPTVAMAKAVAEKVLPRLDTLK